MIGLDEKEDAFNAQIALIQAEKSPIPMLFQPYVDKISSQKEIKDAKSVNTMKILTENDEDAFQASVTEEIKKMTNIQDYAKTLAAQITEVTDEKNGEKQLYQDLVEL